MCRSIKFSGFEYSLFVKTKKSVVLNGDRDRAKRDNPERFIIQTSNNVRKKPKKKKKKNRRENKNNVECSCNTR